VAVWFFASPSTPLPCHSIRFDSIDSLASFTYFDTLPRLRDAFAPGDLHFRLTIVGAGVFLGVKFGEGKLERESGDYTPQIEFEAGLPSLLFAHEPIFLFVPFPIFNLIRRLLLWHLKSFSQCPKVGNVSRPELEKEKIVLRYNTAGKIVDFETRNFPTK